jgi:cell division protease FtsH
VQKISIIPRGIARLGYTLQRPAEDRFLATQGDLEDKLAVLLGGRVAEELIYGEASTGATDDLIKATDLARAMVKSYGMSPALGPVSLERDRPAFFDVPGNAARGEYSETTAREIDVEIHRLVDEQRARARCLLEAQLPTLRAAARSLLAHEPLSGEELAALVAQPSPSVAVA